MGKTFKQQDMKCAHLCLESLMLDPPLMMGYVVEQTVT